MIRFLFAVTILSAGCAHVGKASIGTPPILEMVSPPDEHARADVIEIDAREARRIEAGRFINDWLGVEVVIPDGYLSRIDFKNAQLAVASPEAVGTVVFFARAWNEHNRQRFFDWFVEQIAQDLEPGETLEPAGAEGKPQAVDLEWAHGYQRRYHLGNTVFTAIVGPVCGGRYAIGFVTQELENDQGLTRLRWSHQLGVAGSCRARE